MYSMVPVLSAALLCLLLSCSSVTAQQECEVCEGFLTKIASQLKSTDTPTKIDAVLRKVCKTSKGRENRFCYYVGGLEDSATGILGQISKPLSYAMPPQKICEKIGRNDGQICELRYEKQIDLTKVDLKKLKVRDLKKILTDWDEVCDDCLEKGDFIRFIEKLKPKYVKTEL